MNGVAVIMNCALDNRSIASGAAPYPATPQSYMVRSKASRLASQASVTIALALIGCVSGLPTRTIAASPQARAPVSKTVGDDIAIVVGDQFSKDYSGGGMRRVSANSEACYTSLKGVTGDARTAAYRCILYDIVAYRLDTGMRERFRSQGWNPGPASPYLSDEAFQARRLQTAKAYFQLICRSHCLVVADERNPKFVAFVLQRYLHGDLSGIP